jgi:hypothetical protein
MPCAFCGYPETSNEHVFPQWLQEVLPGEGRIVHEWIAPPGSDSESRTFTTDLFQFKANVVCRDRCNSGWMSDLEDAARPWLEPMIQGRGRTYYDHGREVIAYWALKTAMMIDFAQEKKHRSVPPSLYPALYEAQGVLPDTFVWIGGCDFAYGATARHRTLYLNVDDASFTGFGATIHVGHMVIEVIRVEVEQGKTLQIGGKLAAALRQLWPED